ncbi:LOG family protein YvdD [anaerobic digester metagenome]
MLGQRKITLVYGGSSIGLMRAVADACLENGGHVIGVMPQGLVDREVAYAVLKEMYVVENMSIRKQKMADLSDAFIAMPGGIGTLDEIFEVMSWNQLGIIDKPLGLLNTNGYYNHLYAFLEYAVKQRFVRQEHHENLLIHTHPDALMSLMEKYTAIQVDSKWIDDLKRATSKHLNRK